MTKSDETPVYLAADCGGSHCRVRLYDEDGNRLAEGFGGPSNAALGLDAALSEIFRATREAPACRFRHGRTDRADLA